MAQKTRPDFSYYLGHFTKNREPDYKQTSNPVLTFTEDKTAFDRLKSILKDKKIIAGTLPWNKKNAVCLTECPWSSLVAHSKVYSPYGIGFNKAFIFGTGGAPAFYVRADQFDRQKWDNLLFTFTTPFWPIYRPQKKLEKRLPNDRLFPRERVESSP